MNDFDQFFDESIADCHEDIGEEFVIRGSEIRGIIGDITLERSPEEAGWETSSESVLTVSKTSLLALDGNLLHFNGDRITRKLDGKLYRIVEVVDNGGGLIDLQLNSEFQSS